MAGGLMQLIAYGAQDVFLTGNPQITFFKVVYRRHTNFSIECIQQSLNGSFETDGIQTTTIARNGDLINKSFLHITTTDTPTHDKVYKEGDVYDLLKYIQIDIGGQQIDKQYGDWNNVWWELTTPASKRDSLRDMLIEHSDYSMNSTKGNGIYYPLNFWFCRNIGLSIPLIALQNHEVKIKIEWGTLKNANSTVELWCDYIYLDTDERRRFAQVSHEYLIEQVQRKTTSGNTKSIELNFDHPVKEIIWVNTNEINGTGSQFVPLRNAGSPSGTCYTPAANDDDITLKIQLNGHDRFSYQSAKYFKKIQPYNHHTYVPSSIRKSLSGFLSNTGGQSDLINETSSAKGVGLIVNHKTSRIISAYLCLDIDDAAATAIKLVHGRTQNNDLELSGTTVASELVNGSTVSTKIFKIKADNTSIVRGSKFAKDATGATGIENISMIGIQEPSASGNLQGTLSVEVDELPHLIAGEGHNVCNIYSYSFALKPEEHQPSGTCNFSRLDSAKIISDSIIGNSSDTTSNIIVYAINYNVLRIMSGMGGLAYSS